MIDTEAAYRKGRRDERQHIILRVELWGLECCGGAGDQTNPATGKRWGEEYFRLAKMISQID